MGNLFRVKYFFKCLFTFHFLEGQFSRQLWQISNTLLKCGQTELNTNICRRSYEYIYFCTWGCLVSVFYLQAQFFLQKPELYSHLFLLIYQNWLDHQIPCRASNTPKCQKSNIFPLKVSKVKSILFYDYWHLYILTGHLRWELYRYIREQMCGPEWKTKGSITYTYLSILLKSILPLTYTWWEMVLVTTLWFNCDHCYHIMSRDCFVNYLTS